MARQSDKEGERAEGKHQRYRRPTRPLCCRRHGDRRRRGFSSSPVEIVFPFTLLSALFFLCFFVSNTSSFTTGPTSCTANLRMKNAFPRTPGVFTRSPRQWWQEGTGGSSLSLSAVPSRSFKDDGQKLEGAEGFAGGKAELEPAGWAGSVVLLLQEALFSARRRASLLSRWSSSSSSLSATTASATALTPTTRPAVTSNSPLVANSTPLTSSRRRFFCGPRGGGDSTGGAGGAGGSSGGKGGVGSRIKGGVRVGASLTRLACCVVLLPPVVSFGAGSAATAAAMGGGAGASAAGLGGAAAMTAVEGPFSLVSALLANQWYVWAVLMASSSAGLWSERTQWGAAVSSPLVTMLLTITLCNVGVLPAASPAYDTVNKVFVPLAVPLLLFDADLRKVLRFAGTLLACFVIGAAGTVIGTVAAAAVVPLGLGSDGWKIASALASRHIGGAVNYVAVCETLGVSADAVVAGLAADNMVVSLYFVFLFWITKPEKASPAVASTVPSTVTPSITSTPTVASTTAITATSTVTPTPSGTPAATPTVTPTPTEASAVKPTVKLTVTSTPVVTSTQAPRSEIPSKDITNNTNTTTNNGTNTNDNSNKQTHSSEPDSPPPTPPLPSSEVPTVPGVPLEQAQAVVEGGSDNALPVTKETISYAISAACALCLSGEILAKVAFGGKVSAIPLVTLATVAGATAAPSFIGKLGPVGAQLGVLFMQLFFAVTGAQGNLAIVIGTAPSLLVFSLVQIAVHFGVLVGVGKLCRLPFQELALASNANVGGPTTAAAMAAAKGWKNLVLPALLTGVLGYATATFIGVGMGHAMLKSLIGGAGG